MNQNIDKTLIKYTLILIFVGVLAAAILAGVYSLTMVPIKKYQKDNLLISQKAVLPEAQNFEDKQMRGELLKKFLELYGSVESETNFYLGMVDQKPVGVIFKVAPRGYAGVIKMLVGIDLEGRVRGIKILEQRETPGLGARITDEKFKNTGRPFVAQFFGKAIADPLQPTKDIEAITGATISTGGVCNGVKQALVLFKLYQKGE
jgi:electron transport complex protein RnfG